MESESERASWVAVRVNLVAATVFSVLSVVETQRKAVWRSSPWREDPYYTVVSLAAFAVVMLALAIALRLPARGRVGGAQRAQQTVRAAGAITAVITFTVAFEWAAVIAARNVVRQGGWPATQVGGLVVTTVLALAAGASLGRGRRPRHGPGEWHPDWRHDWLEDVIWLCGRLPGLRRWINPRLAVWTRRHAMALFLVLSVLAAAVIAGAQVVGEGVRDPLFITWLLVAETAANLAFCVLSNAVAGFIARPPRRRARRIVETSVVAGCLADVAAIAFHDPLASALGTRELTSASLAALTLGAGLAVSLLAASLQLVLDREAVTSS